LQEICTAGSAWGDEHKKLCRFGEGTAVKAADNSEAPLRLPLRGSSLPATECTTKGCWRGWGSG